MSQLRHYRRTALTFALLAGLTVAGCGSSASAKPGASSSANSASAQVKADWIAFFSGTTPAARKIALVQDGSDFAKVIDSQSTSGMAKSVAAKVTKVVIARSQKTATVHYSITIGGKPALVNQVGQALKQDGVWKVGAQSFCALLAMEGTKPPICAKL